MGVTRVTELNLRFIETGTPSTRERIEGFSRKDKRYNAERSGQRLIVTWVFVSVTKL